MISYVKKLKALYPKTSKISILFMNSNIKDSQITSEKQKQQNFISNKKFNSNQNQFDSQNKEQIEKSQEKILIKLESGDLIKNKYEEVEIDSFKGKNFTNLTQLQKSIIKQNKFDLSNPELKPKMTSINSFKGVNSTLTQIDLGKIKVKNKNQVFLSQIDPYNIPEDYQIRFDKEKVLTIVGRQISINQRGLEEKKNNQMRISTQESFQENSINQISQKYLGVNYKYQYNRKQSFRSWILAFIAFYLIGYPIFDTFREYYLCKESIKEIESEFMKQVQKIKKQNMMKALLRNQDFNKIL